MTTALWLYTPLTGMQVDRAWLTDVIQTKTGEQRLALRPAARREYELSHLFTPAQYSAAIEQVRAADDYLIPDWASIARVESVVAGDDVTVQIDPDAYDLRPGQAVLLKSETSYEQVEIVSVNDDSVTLTHVESDWLDVRLMMLLPAVTQSGLSVTRLTNRWTRASINLSIQEFSALPSETYPQYRGQDVLEDCPKLQDGLSESIGWPIDIVDSELTHITALRNRAYPTSTYTMRWLVRSGREYMRLLRWLDSRRGRWKAFWFSSRGHDFTLSQDIDAADMQIRIAAIEGVKSLPSTFDIEMVTLSGDVFWRQVVSWIADGSGRFWLTLESAFGAPISIAQVQRISRFRCVRQDADDITLTHNAPGIIAGDVPLIEVPVP